MNGIHDLGGMHGFGEVPKDDATFHADWERDVFGMVMVLGAQGLYTTAQSRHAVERLPPAAYLDSSYFERWLDARLDLLSQSGHISETELASLADRTDGPPTDSTLDPAVRERLLSAVRNRVEADVESTRPADEPRFGAGDRVRVRSHAPAGHTRCPRYVQRAIGTIHATRGAQPYPEARASGDTRYEPLYTVQFDGDELWGESGNERDVVSVDLWEPYLEPVE